MSVAIRLHEQLVLFGTMILCGIVLGILYDGYQEWLLSGKRNRMIHAGVDVLIWVTGALLVFFVLQWGSRGVMRVYVFLALVLGLGIHLKWMSRWVRVVWKQLFKLGSALLDIFVVKWWRILTSRKVRKTGG
jgi:spore cortex biosynthesis protein YabQ